MLTPAHLTYDRMQATEDRPDVVRVYLRIDGTDAAGKSMKGDLIPVDVPASPDVLFVLAGLVATARATHCNAVNGTT